MTTTQTPTVSDQGGGAQERAQQLAGQAQGKAQEAAQQTKGRATQQLDQRSTQAGERVSSAAQDARSVSGELRKQGKEGPAKLADQAAERAERLGSYLKDSDGDRILGDIEDFGRRQPLAMLVGGLVIGLAASRFLKASSSRRYQASSSGHYPVSRPLPAARYGDGAASSRYVTR
jgi:hypothetical protein